MSEIIVESHDFETVQAELFDKLARLEGQSPDEQAFDRLRFSMDTHGTEDRKAKLFDAFIAANTEFERVLLAVELLNCFRRDKENGSNEVISRILTNLNEDGKKFEMPYSSIIRSYVRNSQLRLNFKQNSYGKANASSMIFADRSANHAKKAMEYVPEGSEEVHPAVNHPVARGIFWKALSTRTDAYLELHNTTKANEALADEMKFGFQLSGKNLAWRNLNFALVGLDEVATATGISSDKIKIRLLESWTKTLEAAEAITTNDKQYLDVQFSVSILQFKLLQAMQRFGIQVPEVNPNERIRGVIEARLTAIGQPDFFSALADEYLARLRIEKCGVVIEQNAKQLLGITS